MRSAERACVREVSSLKGDVRPYGGERPHNKGVRLQREVEEEAVAVCSGRLLAAKLLLRRKSSADSTSNSSSRSVIYNRRNLLQHAHSSILTGVADVMAYFFKEGFNKIYSEKNVDTFLIPEVLKWQYVYNKRRLKDMSDKKINCQKNDEEQDEEEEVTLERSKRESRHDAVAFAHSGEVLCPPSTPPSPLPPLWTPVHNSMARGGQRHSNAPGALSCS